MSSNLKRGFLAISVATLFSVAPFSYADDAPVYEVDNYPPFDQSASTESYDPGAYSPPASHGAPTHAYVPPSAREYPPPAQPLSTSERLTRLERQMTNLQSSNPAAKAESLQKEVQTLRGQVEELTHQLQVAMNQQKAMFSDLDKRVSDAVSAKPLKVAEENSDAPSAHPRDTLQTSAKLPKTMSEATSSAKVNKPTSQTRDVTAKSVSVEQPNVAEEQQIYQTAYDLIKAKKYNEAINTLQKMLQKYPTGQFAANAHYWLGELYGLLNKNEQSAAEFAKVVDKYPDSPKVSDAHLKLGLIYIGQLKWDDARDVFKKVVKLYPGTSSARLASEQLKQIKSAGH